MERQLPKNVRQIGNVCDEPKIYVEDYVYTFLKRLSEEEKEQGKAAVLTGEIKWTEDMICVFVKGALAADEMEATVEHIDFSEEIWQRLQENKEKYFPDQEIVGWFFAQHQSAVEITDLLVKTHLRYFGGEKILILMEPVERDEAFFRYDGGTMVKVEGYYIYYEKNSQMQTYMIERNQNAGPETSEKVEDKAVRNFRKIIDSKKPEEREEEKTSVFSYAATVCLALAVLATGVAFFQNRQKQAPERPLACRQKHISTFQCPALRHGGFACFNFRAGNLNVPVQLLALRGQHRSVAAALEQFNSNLLFQLLDRARETWL